MVNRVIGIDCGTSHTRIVQKLGGAAVTELAPTLDPTLVFLAVQCKADSEGEELEAEDPGEPSQAGGQGPSSYTLVVEYEKNLSINSYNVLATAEVSGLKLMLGRRKAGQVNERTRAYLAQQGVELRDARPDEPDVHLAFCYTDSQGRQCEQSSACVQVLVKDLLHHLFVKHNLLPTPPSEDDAAAGPPQVHICSTVPVSAPFTTRAAMRTVCQQIIPSAEVTILEEPLAGLCFKLEQQSPAYLTGLFDKQPRIMVVVDYGHGTVDVTVLSVLGPQQLEVVLARAFHDCGGQEFTHQWREALVDGVMEQLVNAQSKGKPLLGPAYQQVRDVVQRFVGMGDADRAKQRYVKPGVLGPVFPVKDDPVLRDMQLMQLYEKYKRAIFLDLLDLSKPKFRALMEKVAVRDCGKLLQKPLAALQSALESIAGSASYKRLLSEAQQAEPSSSPYVICIGGGMNMLQVQKVVKQVFQVRNFWLEDTSTRAVAHGAVQYLNPERRIAISDSKIFHDVGFVLDVAGRGPVLVKLLAADTQLPVERLCESFYLDGEKREFEASGFHMLSSARRNTKAIFQMEVEIVEGVFENNVAFDRASDKYTSRPVYGKCTSSRKGQPFRISVNVRDKGTMHCELHIDRKATAVKLDVPDIVVLPQNFQDDAPAMAATEAGEEAAAGPTPPLCGGAASRASCGFYSPLEFGAAEQENQAGRPTGSVAGASTSQTLSAADGADAPMLHGAALKVEARSRSASGVYGASCTGASQYGSPDVDCPDMQVVSCPVQDAAAVLADLKHGQAAGSLLCVSRRKSARPRHYHAGPPPPPEAHYSPAAGGQLYAAVGAPAPPVASKTAAKRSRAR